MKFAPPPGDPKTNPPAKICLTLPPKTADPLLPMEYVVLPHSMRIAPPPHVLDVLSTGAKTHALTDVLHCLQMNDFFLCKLLKNTPVMFLV